MTLTNHKRRLVEDDSDSETEVRKVACHAGVEGAWPRFLVVEGADPALPLDRLSPFAVEKGFQAISSTGFKDIKRQKSGGLSGGVLHQEGVRLSSEKRQLCLC